MTDPSITKLRIISRREESDLPPAHATHVRVFGGADAMVVEFLYVPADVIHDALDGRGGGSIEVSGDTVTVRAPCAARVAIPLSVALDLIQQLVEVASDGSVEIVNQVRDVGRSLTDTIEGVPARLKEAMER